MTYQLTVAFLFGVALGMWLMLGIVVTGERLERRRRVERMNDRAEMRRAIEGYARCN